MDTVFPRRLQSTTIRKYQHVQKTFKVIHFLDEYAMLKDFMQYIRDARISGICYFNGHKFDLPFVELRLTTLSTAARDDLYPTTMCPTWKGQGKQARQQQKQKQQNKSSMYLSFTHRSDMGKISYRPSRTSTFFRKQGLATHARDIQSQRGLKRPRTSDDSEDNDDYHDSCNDDDGDDDDYDDDDDDDDDHDAAPLLNPMIVARHIKHITMTTIGMVDVMLEVGDRGRGCKLDDAGNKWLSVQKVHDERVTYANLTRTFQHGSIADLQVAYALF